VVQLGSYTSECMAACTQAWRASVLVLYASAALGLGYDCLPCVGLGYSSLLCTPLFSLWKGRAAQGQGGGVARLLFV